jgi:hypothetical protein
VITMVTKLATVGDKKGVTSVIPRARNRVCVRLNIRKYCSYFYFVPICRQLCHQFYNPSFVDTHSPREMGTLGNGVIC